MIAGFELEAGVGGLAAGKFVPVDVVVVGCVSAKVDGLRNADADAVADGFELKSGYCAGAGRIIAVLASEFGITTVVAVVVAVELIGADFVGVVM